MPLKYNNTG